jgi:hypothetical protein
VAERIEPTKMHGEWLVPEELSTWDGTTWCLRLAFTQQDFGQGLWTRTLDKEAIHFGDRRTVTSKLREDESELSVRAKKGKRATERLEAEKKRTRSVAAPP